MIQATDIRRKVVEELNKAFADVDVLNPNIVEDYDKHVFFVYIDSLTWASYSNTLNQYTYQVQIQFHEEEDIELMEMGEILSQVFSGVLEVGDRQLLIGGGLAEIDKMNLFYTFDLTFTAPKKQKNLEDYPLMKKLNTRIVVEGGEING